MVRFLALAALAVATPALAGHDRTGWSGESRGYALNRTSAFVRDDRYGPRIYSFSRDDGYFNGRGRGVSIAGGKAMFDYDRDYPYDFPSGWGAGEPDFGPADEDGAREPACSLEPVRDRRAGGAAEVRICR